MSEAIPSDELRLVFVTHPPEGAEAFARRLVESRLAACVNVLAASSVYRWEGAVQEDAERLLVLKSRAELQPELARFLDEHHPYDVPEHVAVAPREVGSDYLAWWRSETARGEA